MKKYVLIGFFGFLGAICRYLLKSMDFMSLQRQFPINVLAVNLLGSFAFAVVVTAAYETGRISPEWRLGLTAGFLGAFTTFSTFCKDTVGLLSVGRLPDAFLYAAGSLLFGILAVCAGTSLTQHFVLKASGAGGSDAGKKRPAAKPGEEKTGTGNRAVD